MPEHIVAQLVTAVELSRSVRDGYLVIISVSRFYMMQHLHSVAFALISSNYLHSQAFVLWQRRSLIVRREPLVRR